VQDVYANFVYELEERGRTTRVALSQDGNADDEAAEHSRSNWETVLSGLKQTVESR
jgi:hypothetical protein